MHLKIDTKQKIKYIRSYLTQLRTSSTTSPFITINPSQCGFFQYDYITKRRKTIHDIDRDVKDNKYENVKEVCQDLKALFQNVADYLLLGDRLQDELGRLGRGVWEFQGRFAEDFRENRLLKDNVKPLRKQELRGIKAGDRDQDPSNPSLQPPNPSTSAPPNSKQKPDQPQTPVSQTPPPPLLQFNRKSTFGQKLQMLFYLRAHQDNMEYVKSIGESYGIGRQERDGDGEFVIRLEANAGNCLWLELLQKKDQ